MIRRGTSFCRSLRVSRQELAKRFFLGGRFLGVPLGYQDNSQSREINDEADIDSTCINSDKNQIGITDIRERSSTIISNVMYDALSTVDLNGDGVQNNNIDMNKIPTITICNDTSSNINNNNSGNMYSSRTGSLSSSSSSSSNSSSSSSSVNHNSSNDANLICKIKHIETNDDSIFIEKDHKSPQNKNKNQLDDQNKNFNTIESENENENENEENQIKISNFNPQDFLSNGFYENFTEIDAESNENRLLSSIEHSSGNVPQPSKDYSQYLKIKKSEIEKSLEKNLRIKQKREEYSARIKIRNSEKWKLMTEEEQNLQKINRKNQIEISEKVRIER